VQETIIRATIVIQKGAWLTFRDLLEQDGANRPSAAPDARAMARDLAAPGDRTVGTHEAVIAKE
jgi:hypothetical protein